MARRLRAIDLYSGVGGWSLGLTMAGIDVVASYEWWDPANRTNQINNNHVTHTLDIRGLDLAKLPSGIDIVVGSPPCTEFSFSNRGGSGDIEDGLKDLKKFLEVVDAVRPRYWAMENVPRAGQVLQKELLPGGQLEAFAHLNPRIEVVDMCEFGLPQKRLRCIAGNFDFERLFAYRQKCSRLTLGDVINNLSESVVVDPIYGVTLPASKVTDQELESFLNKEEERMNREAKTYHPIYNNMSFPDRLDRPVRTITATCTRVSRESVVVRDPRKKGQYRRLSVRERGVLQGFPVSFQFYGESHAQKLKMIGNAIPPLFTFYIAQAMRGLSVEKLVPPSEGIKRFTPASQRSPVTSPDSAGASYSETRRFRAAIPHLRFKSGVRFELANSFADATPAWVVSFYYGSSKSIQQLHLDKDLGRQLEKHPMLRLVRTRYQEELGNLDKALSGTDAFQLQRKWARKVSGGMGPYDVVDTIGDAAAAVIDLLDKSEVDTVAVLTSVFKHLYREIDLPLADAAKGHGLAKMLRHATAILSGILVGCHANGSLLAKDFQKAA